jgi:hypothetical protein
MGKLYQPLNVPTLNLDARLNPELLAPTMFIGRKQVCQRYRPYHMHLELPGTMLRSSLSYKKLSTLKLSTAGIPKTGVCAFREFILKPSL